MYKRIVLAYDGSEAGQKSLLATGDIAQWSHATLHLIAVMPLTYAMMGIEGGFYSAEWQEQEKQQYIGTLNDGLRRLSDAGYQAHGELLHGETVQELTRHAKSVDADLIVVGHKHQASWAKRWWQGSVSGSLIEHAPCSVLVVITG